MSPQAEQEILNRLGAIEAHLRLARIPLPPLLTLSETARYLRLSRPKVGNLIASGQLEASSIKLGSRKAYRVSVAQVEAYLLREKEKGYLVQAASKRIKIPDVKL